MELEGDMGTSDSGAMNDSTGHAPSEVPRRRFVEILLGTGFVATAVAFLYPLFRYLVPPKTADLGGDSVIAAHVGDVKPNSGKVFPFGTRPGILVLTASGEYRAMAATCTHLGCTVQFRPDLQHIWCACHNGHYDLNGRNIAGPPPRPLEFFDVQVRGQEIYVRRKEG